MEFLQEPKTETLLSTTIFENVQKYSHEEYQYLEHKLSAVHKKKQAFDMSFK